MALAVGVPLVCLVKKCYIWNCGFNGKKRNTCEIHEYLREMTGARGVCDRLGE